MSRKITFHCSVCNKPRGEGNRWIMAIRVSRGSWPAYHPGGIWVSGWMFMDWDHALETIDDDAEVRHICSEQCQYAMQAQFLRQDRIDVKA